MLGWRNSAAKADKRQKDFQKHEQDDSTLPTQKTKWQKTYGFLGFNKGYNFPLCKSHRFDRPIQC